MDYLASWAGRARITYTHSPTPITLLSTTSKAVSLPELCAACTPPCNLNPLLFNGHLQTIWTAVKASGVPIYYKRHIFEAAEDEYAGSFAVDFTVAAYEDVVSDESLPPRTAYYTDREFAALGGLDDKPMLVVLHGLSGGSYEIYLRSVIKPLLEPGWECIVVNSRGCAMSKLTTAMLYNARATWDVRQMVSWCRQMWPNRKLFGLGFSLGANILTNVRRAMERDLEDGIQLF